MATRLLPSRSSATGPGTFLFIAGKPGGGRTIGLRRAATERALADELRRDRLVPLRMWRAPLPGAAPLARISLKDQAELNTQLAQLLGRGVPLVEALEVCVTAVSPALRPRIIRMRELVSSGSSFADACETVGCFDRVTVAVYRAAERTGDLAGAAKQLSITARRQVAISNKVLTLMLYPAIVGSIGLILGFAMMAFIVPRIASALTQVQGDKPFPFFTRIVFGTGMFLDEHLVPVLIVIGCVLVLAIIMRRPILASIGGLSRRAPLLRDVVLAQESARFFTVMSAMTRSGVTLGDALGVGVGALSHPMLKTQLTRLRTRLIEGGVLRQLIDEVTALPLPTRRLLIAAERSGDLQAAFDTLATDTAEEVERRSTRLLAVLEPALIVALFLFIGGMVLSIMIPLMNMSKGLGG
ncbi:MAG: type II secretion system F family protein [Planctomycetota bacterium]|jgi:type II secretory pathway component PulF|nr:type II secretion system F family protein [Planctomycetota bacterium]